MDAIDFFLITIIILAVIVGQHYVNKAQDDVNKSMLDFVSFSADRIDELVKENKNLQNKVDLLESSVYYNNEE